MSTEQDAEPEPATAGEWTPMCLARFYAAGQLQEQQLAAAINAAIAEHRAEAEDAAIQETLVLREQLAQLREQLAAEREKKK